MRKMTSSLLTISLLAVCLTLVCTNSPEATAADGLNGTLESPSAQLKPLDQVAGTNLFYNLPYRWLDDTKPGCFVTWFWEVFQDTPDDKNRGVSLACNNDDQKWYNNTNSEWIIEKPKPNEKTTNGNIAIRNIGSGYTLERLHSAGTLWVAVDDFAFRIKRFRQPFSDGEEMPDVHTWNILADPKNKNRVQLEIDGYTLAQHELSNHRAYLWVKPGFDAGYPYTFVPTIAMELHMDDFQFVRPIADELAKHTSQKALMDEYTINNPSTASVRRTVEVSQTVRNEFSWGLSQSIKNALKVKGKVGIPFLAEGEIENTFEVGFGANENWKSGEDKTFKMSYEVSVPPNSTVKISAWYDHIKDLRMDYTARAVITGKTQRITVFEDIVQDVPATGDMIRKQLESSGFDGTILEIKNDRVIVRVKGSMVATVGVRGRLNVNNDTVARSEPE
ncbi:uncharacterized protein LOC119073010 [Bradysia coprophila]|uniref:uncharacterized protein LOC119073010 n=1 Tax=Bradysia coprophila TaxID=38358 RepID=UPI00187DD5B5|nr:uncharacterized protein LOC119073010 [Bradysia coprophila]